MSKKDLTDIETDKKSKTAAQTRRRFLRTAGLGIAALSLPPRRLFADNMEKAKPFKGRRPNVVLMLADNLGYGDLGAYGGGETRGMPTPRIDRLAGESLLFTQFLAEPMCTPSRAALMTGRYPVRMGLSLVLVEGLRGGNGLKSSEYTMAEMFKGLGYSTAHFGKWHLGSFGESIPTRQGFDEFYGILNTTDETLYAKSMKRAHLDDKYRFVQPMIHEGLGGQDLKPVKPFNEETRRTIDMEVAAKSIDFIRQKAKEDTPFFLYIPWTRPHYPNLPSAEFAGKSRIGDYGDSVMELDHNTGRVLDALKEAGIEDDTIVIWLSDNGPMETVTWPDSGNAGRYRGELGDAYEGSIRTAGMIKWPGRIRAGKTNEMIAILDLMPTLAKMAGGEMPTDRPIDGVDQSNFLLGKQMTSNREHLLSFIGDNLVALRWNQYRVYFTDYEPSGEWFKQAGAGANALPRGWAPKVFNIERDPGEKQDVSQYSGWMMPYVMRHIMEYKASTQKFPNLPAPNFTRW